MLRLSAFALFGVAVCVSAASAGPDRVALPDYRSNAFARYMIVDRPDRKRARFMYVNRTSLDAATPGAPAPEGTVVVMEDHNAALDDAGEPRRDEIGRFVPIAANGSVFVMEKRAGWGAAYAEDKRNGDWG